MSPDHGVLRSRISVRGEILQRKGTGRVARSGRRRWRRLGRGGRATLFGPDGTGAGVPGAAAGDREGRRHEDASGKPRTSDRAGAAHGAVESARRRRSVGRRPWRARAAPPAPLRLMPSLVIRLSSVVGLSPSSSAAPPLPRIRPPVDSSTDRMCSVSTSTNLRLLRRVAAVGCGQLDDEAGAVGDDHRPLDHVPQLADVAGPRVALQRLEARLRQRLDRLAERAGELVDEGPRRATGCPRRARAAAARAAGTR